MTAEQNIDAAVDDRPIAVRRKRRVQALRLQEPESDTATDCQQDATATEVPMKDTTSTVSTPQKKRVRFSDPGPEIIPTSSTGLTPALRRHRVTSTPKTKGVSKRRHSFPAKAASPVTPSATTLQFAPLRQLIDGRLRRRLRRNHLSEEINAIEEEKNNERRLRRESINALRKEVEEKEERLEELNRQLNCVMQACAQTPPPGEANGSDESLAEIDQVLDQTAGRIQEQENANKASFTTSDLSSFLEVGMNNDEALENPASDEMLQPGAIIHTEALPERNLALLQPQLPTISAGIQVSFVDEERERLKKEIEELKEALQTVINESERTQSDHQRLFDKIQGHLQDLSSSFSDNPSEIDAALDTILTSLVLAQSRAEDAEAKVATLSSNVKDLGFNGDTTDEMIRTIKHQFRQARLELEHLQPGETVGGFENGKLLRILIEHIRLLLQKLKDTEQDQDHQRHVIYVLQEQLDLVDAQEKSAAARAREVAKDLNEKERSIKSLQRALEGYRKEVKDLEKLVNRLEAEHAKAIEQSRKDRDEAVADLEVKLGVEARTRDEAILEAQEKKALADSLQETIGRAMSVIGNLKEEREILLTAKDTIVSRFQTEAAEKDAAYEMALATSKAEMDNLRSERTALMVSLNEAEISIGTLTDANTALEARLSLEIESSVRVMESMQSEMMRSLARVSELKNNYASRKNGDAGPGMVMPATPCSLRFATTPKKRRRIDSGIGVVEEEDEEMVDI